MFKLLPDGTGYEKLLDLNCPSTGCTPKGALYFDGTFLYGMTDLGGTSNSGTIFKIMTDGSNFEKLFDFDGDANGSNPSLKPKEIEKKWKELRRQLFPGLRTSALRKVWESFSSRFWVCYFNSISKSRCNCRWLD